MAEFMGIDNSIGWAHWKLKGGWKNLFVSVFAYVLIVGGLIFLTLHMTNPRRPGAINETLSVWRSILLYLQAAMATLLAGTRIAVAVRSDINNRMAESHALMPVPALAAVSGYIWGPTIQPVGLMIANFLIGLGICFQGGYNIGIWIGPNIVVASFGLFCGVVAAFSSFASRLGWGGVFGALITMGFSQGIFLPYLPPLMVLATPFIGNSIFRPSITNYSFDTAILVSMFAQICIGAILYIGAARKYRRADQSALGILPGLLLVFCWGAAAFVGIRYIEDFRFRARFLSSLEADDFVQILMCAIASCMLLALAPIANAARDVRWKSRSPLIAMLCAGMIGLFCLAESWDFDVSRGAIAYTAVSIACSLLSTCYVLRIVYRVAQRGWQIGLIWTVIFWVIPNLVDYGLWVMSDTENPFTMTFASAISPIGLMMMAWRSDFDPGTILAFGSAAQIALAVGWMILFVLTDRSHHATRIND